MDCGANNAEIRKMKQETRRKFLASTGTGIAAFTGIVSGNPSRKTSDFDFPTFEERVESKYGKESKVIKSVVYKHLGRKKKRGLSEQETYERITEEFLSRPDTPQIAEDIQDVRSAVKKQNKITTNSVGTQDNVCDCGGGGDSTSIVASNGSTEEHTAGGATSYSDYTIYSGAADVARVALGSAVYGSSYVRTRLWGTFTPDSDGDYDINADYWRHCAVAGGSLDINIFIRRVGGGVNAKTVENLSAGVKGDASFTKKFTMSAGENYHVGVETIGQASNSDPSGTSVDMYTSSKNYELALNYMALTPL